MSGGPELVKIVSAMAKEKGIDTSIVFESLEIAMMAAARRRYEDAEEIEISVDRLDGQFTGYVDEDPIEDGVLASLGRIAAQTFKQVMIQRLREAEQDVVFEEFESRIGELVVGTIQRFEGENVIIDINNSEAIMPRHERVRTETYHVGDRVRCVIFDVRRVGHRVRIVLSRTHPDLIQRLFELEIPEIADHIIEVKGLAREAGFRTKLAVVSYDSKVDCVGACVGIRGSRIRNIIDELNGEKIDIIRWSESPEVLIMNSLKPAEIQSITLDDETGEALVQVAEDQLSLAIGKRGQNVRLAARLTGWDVNIQGEGVDKLSGGGAAGASLNEAEQRILEQLKTGAELEGPPTTAPAKPASVEPKTESESDPLLAMARQQMAQDQDDEEIPVSEAPTEKVATPTTSADSTEEDDDPLLAMAREAAARGDLDEEAPKSDEDDGEDNELKS